MRSSEFASGTGMDASLRIRLLVSAFCLLLWNCKESPSGNVEDASCGLEFSQVAGDSSRAAAYFAERSACDSALRRTKASGKLLGLLFDPSEKTLTEEFTRAYGGRGFTTLETAGFIDATLAGLGKTESIALAEISSIRMDYFARGTPVFILLHRLLVSSTYVRNDHDMQGIFAHELQHVDDWHDGLDIRGVKLDSKSLADASISADWLIPLMELRADYKVLTLVYKDRVEFDSAAYSFEWFASQAPNYMLHWNAVSDLARTDLEMKVAGLQKTEFAGMVPELKGDSLFLHYDLYGRKETATFLYTRPAAPKGTGSSKSEHPLFLGWRP
jgi:hypothetical protein